MLRHMLKFSKKTQKTSLSKRSWPLMRQMWFSRKRPILTQVCEAWNAHSEKIFNWSLFEQVFCDSLKWPKKFQTPYPPGLGMGTWRSAKVKFPFCRMVVFQRVSKKGYCPYFLWAFHSYQRSGMWADCLAAVTDQGHRHLVFWRSPWLSDLLLKPMVVWI